MLAPSKFSGGYKKVASDINDGIDKIAAKGGAPRRAADLEQVLGPIPAAPTMSAFAVPGPGESSSTAIPVPGAAPAKPLPKALPKPKPRPGLSQSQDGVDAAEIDDQGTPSARKPPPPLPKAKAEAEPEPVAEAVEGEAEVDEMTEWQKVYEEFLAVKTQCGEPTTGMTFEKFKSTLQRNKDALVQRHGVTRVKFTVYVKDGKAALKASPVTK
jgi:hypothetical protein